MYYEPIDFGLNFKNTIFKFKQWAENNGHWHQNETSAGSWILVPQDFLLSILEFQKFFDRLKLANLAVKNSILRKTNPNKFSGIHIDDIESPAQGRVPCSLSLNLALENETSAITRWYDFSSHPTFSNHVFEYNKQDPNSPFKKIYDNNINEFLKYCVGSTVMSNNIMINTSVPHNVDTRNSTVPRYILSMRFLDLETNEILSWQQRHKILRCGKNTTLSEGS